MKIDPKRLRLYAVTDRAWTHDTEGLLRQVAEAIDGGAGIVQLREKHLGQADFLAEAERFVALCREKGAVSIINDNVEIAAQVGADGVHVGQEDLEAGRARELLGPDKLIGVSAHSVEEALAAQAAGADYLGVGAAFVTGTKTDAKPISRETIRAITAAVDIPVVGLRPVRKNRREGGGGGAAAALGGDRPMNIRGAIFDLDGTLTDSMYIWQKAPVDLVRRYGGDPPEDLARDLKEMGRREAAEYLRSRFSLSATPEELMDTLNDLVTEEYRSRVPMKPGADRLLARLADSGISCCIATASEAFQARSAMERLGLWQHFRFAVSCVQYGGKTRPDIYLEAARRLGTAPGETVVFEDALHAARTAHEAGFRVCGVWDASAEEDQAALKALADWYVRDLGDWIP